MQLEVGSSQCGPCHVVSQHFLLLGRVEVYLGGPGLSVIFFPPHSCPLPSLSTVFSVAQHVLELTLQPRMAWHYQSLVSASRTDEIAHTLASLNGVALVCDMP